VWLNERRPARRAAPAGLDRERIVAAAIRLLDAEGLAGFSMRRLAAELGVSAMSVYWYVDNKDDLLEMALDAVQAEVALPDPDADGDWREQLRQIARAYRRALLAHTWAARLFGDYLNLGPRARDISSTLLRIMDRAGLPRQRSPAALSAVFQFTFGCATVESRWLEQVREAGVTQNELFNSVLEPLLDNPGWAEQRSIMQERAAVDFEEGRERDFLFALDTVIAGVEVMVERYGERGAR
jgi:AcrR family transcriptional regulator